MTTIHISKQEKDALHKVCAMADIPVFFMENIKGDDLTATVYTETPSVMFYLGRSVEIEIQRQEILKRKF